MPGLEAPLSEAAAACVHAYRVGSNAVPALVQAGDLAMDGRGQHAGPGKEHPNWRRKLGLPVETLIALGSAQAILAEVRRKRETPPRSGQGKASR